MRAFATLCSNAYHWSSLVINKSPFKSKYFHNKAFKNPPIAIPLTILKHTRQIFGKYPPLIPKSKIGRIEETKE